MPVKKKDTIEETKEFDTVALSIIKGEGKKRKVIEIPFNSETLEVGEAKVIFEGENLWDAKYMYEVTAVRKGLLNVD